MITDAELDKFADNLTTIAVYAAKQMIVRLQKKRIEQLEKRVAQLELRQQGTEILEDMLGYTLGD